ncbi:MAG: 2-oxo acid dehydrogenase subunit E2 [Deltaproteobacteria bacterium]|nr:2-oxo acid dehydrogenase subunit E2 [Deltaproteobacteria bacterium]
MKIALTMPQFGESITEALIVRWLKKEGDEAKEQEPLIEMETEKSVFSYESPFKGKLSKILLGENQKAPVGKEIAYFEVADSLGEKYLSMGIGKVVGGSEATSSGPVVGTSGKGLSPLIRSMAKDHNIPIEEVEKWAGTGPGGRLTREDFQKQLDSRGEKEDSAKDPKIVVLTPIRARIAEKMLLSKKEIPHASTGLDVDVTLIDDWRKKNNLKLGYLPFLLSAVLPALKKFPLLNSSLKGQGSEQRIEEYSSIHLGIATSTSQGLMVPVLKNADRRRFSEIVEEMGRLIGKAREGRLELSELTGATFTVNNTGALGAVRSGQIIPHPQSGILAVNRVTRRPWVVNEKIEIRSILPLDLAFDHRIVDGEAACGFLTEVKARLERFDFSLI